MRHRHRPWQPAGDEDAGIVTSAKTRLAEIEEAKSKKDEGDGSYEIMNAGQRVVMKDKDETRFLFILV